ncbi:MAG: hypothetical protein ACI9H8_001845 [Lysobacterales bacterium]|jgi:hypothetical protein
MLGVYPMPNQKQKDIFNLGKNFSKENGKIKQTFAGGKGQDIWDIWGQSKNIWLAFPGQAWD